MIPAQVTRPTVESGPERGGEGAGRAAAPSNQRTTLIQCRPGGLPERVCCTFDTLLLFTCKIIIFFNLDILSFSHFFSCPKILVLYDIQYPIFFYIFYFFNYYYCPAVGTQLVDNDDD